jgi:hypothetical protein
MARETPGEEKRSVERGFYQRVRERFSSTVYMPCTRYTRFPNLPLRAPMSTADVLRNEEWREAVCRMVEIGP